MIIDRVKAKFQALEEGQSKWEQVESPDHFVSMEKIFERKSPVVVGRAVTVVDASVEECCSWDFMKMSREYRKWHMTEGGLERDALTFNEHHITMRVCWAVGVPGFLPREFVYDILFRIDDDGSGTVMPPPSSQTWAMSLAAF